MNTMMLKKCKFIFLLLCVSLCTPAYNQNLTGLWEVTKVTVGDEILTPIAKWFDYQPDGSYTSGNGGLQNLLGNWKVEKGKLFTDNAGKSDGYGPFTLEKTESGILMKRSEDGMDVNVQLSRIKKKPLAPWDLILGSWKLEQVEGTEEVSLYFRWDRRFVIKGTVDGLRSGYWYIHPHAPEIRLISAEGDAFDRSCSLQFEDKGKKMTWKWNKTSDQEAEQRWVFIKS